MNRYFTEQPLTLNATAKLEASIQKHAIKVLRQGVGDHFELVHDACAFDAEIIDVSPLTVKLIKDITRSVELPIDVHLVCGVGKGDKAEWIVQKATELGASSISFANTQWGTAKWSPEKLPKKLARLQAVALGAAEQSHRNVVPSVKFTKLGDLSLDADQVGVVAYEEAAKAGEAAQLVQTVKQHPQSMIAVFGPEGGLSPQEVDGLQQNGFVPAGLGPRIMRTETAPLYLLSAISALVELQEI